MIAISIALKLKKILNCFIFNTHIYIYIYITILSNKTNRDYSLTVKYVFCIHEDIGSNPFDPNE